MTRETKAGIVVTASFLSLIGGVLAVKYIQNRPESTIKTPEQKQVAQAGASAGDHIPAPPMANNPETPTTGGSETPTSNRSGDPPGKLLIGSETPGSTPGASPPSPGGITLPGTTPPAIGEEHKNPPTRPDNPDKDDEFPSPIKRTGHAEEEKKTTPPPPAPPPMPPATSPMSSSASPMDSTKPGDPPPLLPGVGKIDLPMAPAGGPKLSPPETGSKPASPPPPISDLDPPPLLGPMNHDKAKEPPKTTKPVDNPKDIKTSPMTIDPPPTLPMSKPEEKPKLESPKLVELPKTGDMPPKLEIVLPKNGDSTTKPSIDLPKPGDTGTKPTLDLPKPGADTPKPTVDLPKPPMTDPKPALELTKPGTTSPMSTQDLTKPGGGYGPMPPDPRTGGPMPPQDLNPGGARLDPSGARPIDNQPEPPVNSYDEEWHYCRQQGETLESISQKYYFTPKYEQALRQYNLDRNPAPVFQQEKPTLSVGQVVKVPPARILERLYPASIRGGRPAVPVSPTAATTAGSKNPAASLGPVAAKDLGGPHEYTISREGMTLKDVARDELGNESQWHRIFLLNRWVNPSAPLAPGTKLFLPRVGTQ